MSSKANEKLRPVVHLLVDFENRKPSPSDVACIRSEEYRLWVFHGPHQNKFDADLVKAWQPLGGRVDFVQSSKHGKNALDFHIAFKLGVLQVEDRAAQRQASYVVVSGDGGFEPLFEYMRTRECTVTRAGSIAEALAIPIPANPVVGPGVAAATSQTVLQRPSRGIIPAVPQKVPASAPKKKAVAAAAPIVRKSIADGDVAAVIAELRAHPRNRPGDRAALERYIVARLGNKIAPEVAKVVIGELEQQKIVSFDGKKVAYRVPKAKK
jgi:hypothetical protein